MSLNTQMFDYVKVFVVVWNVRRGWWRVRVRVCVKWRRWQDTNVVIVVHEVESIMLYWSAGAGREQLRRWVFTVKFGWKCNCTFFLAHVWARRFGQVLRFDTCTIHSFHTIGIHYISHEFYTINRIFHFLKKFIFLWKHSRLSRNVTNYFELSPNLL